ncbi:MAG: CHAP domain-containing protein [Clostridia bacterium]|nr:CHAP domain-containing protein [Clostridia bacterium]
MKRRYELFAIILSFLLFFGTIPSVPVSAASNPYGKYQTIGGVTTVRCTWYAWQQAYDRTGVALPALGDGGQWYSNAKNKGLSVGTTAKENSIAVWSGDSYGHVAYVVGVSGNKMTVNEAGQYVGNIVYGNEGIVNGAVWSNVIGSSKTSGSNKKLVGFIYLSTNNSGDHTHIFNEYESYRAEHPHYNYYKCSCGATQTNTNEPNYVESCEICNPLKVTATDDSKPTGFSWYNFENAKSYDLRINKMPSGENILTEFGIKNNEYSYNLPAGDYRAELCAGNVNGTIDWFPTVDFTVGTSNIDIADTYPETPQIEIEVVGNEIFATWNKCDNADKYNAYLTYYTTEEDLINNGLDPESFYASIIWEAEDQELNVGASIGDYMFSSFVAQTNATYRIKVEAINSTTEAKTVAYSEAITIKKYKAGDMNGDEKITDQDAIYLLFSYYFPDEYPINQPADFNKDGNVTDQDAIYLLFYVYFPKEYPI